jgi:hypothetical protein
LISEAAEDALDDNDEAAAVVWAEGYEFPERHLASDIKLLEASALDFEVMVRRRQRQCRPAPYGHCTLTVRYVCFRTSLANA